MHFDVDVLDDAIMPPSTTATEGGLSWDEAAQLLQGLLVRPGACGLNVTIFNPNLDPGGSIARQLSNSSAAASRPHEQALTKNARQPSGSGRAASGPHPGRRAPG